MGRYPHILGGVLIAVLFLGVSTGPVARADDIITRTWTSVDGKFSRRADLLEQNNQAVKLRLESGREVSVPLAQLCKEDLAYLKTLPKVDAKKKKKVTANKPSIDSGKGLVGKSAIAGSAKSTSAQATAISKAETLDEFKLLIHTAFGEKQYDLLEATSLALRADDTIFEKFTISPKLEIFYGVLAQAPRGPAGAPVPYSEAIVDWLKARPKSKVPRLAAALHEVRGAWDARGAGSAATVTEAGWQVFHARIEAACALLAQAEELPGDDPYFYKLIFTVAKAQSWKRAEVEKYYAAMMKTSPDYFPAHASFATMLMPRWGGEPGDMERQTAASADRVGGARGDELYASVVGELITYHRRKFFEETQFDYERVIRGYDSILARHPNAVVALQAAAYLSSVKNDVPRAAKYFQQLKAQGNVTVASYWGSDQALVRAMVLALQANDRGIEGPLMPAPQQRVNTSGAVGGGLTILPRDTRVPPLPAPVEKPPEEPWKPSSTPIAVQKAGVRAIAFLPGGRFLFVATTTAEGRPEIGIWDASNGQNRMLERNSRLRPDDTVEIFDVAVHPLGSIVNVFGVQQTNGFDWNYNVTHDPGAPNAIPKINERGMSTTSGRSPFFSYAPNGHLYMQAFKDGSGIMFDTLERGKSSPYFRNIQSKGNALTAGAFSPDSKLLTVALTSGEIMFSMVPTPYIAANEKPTPVKITDKQIAQICFANDSKLVCCAEAGGTIHLYDMAAATVTGKLQAPGELKQIAIHPGGRLLATAHGESDCICLWDVVAKKEVQRFTGHTGDINTISFASNGQVLASGSQDGTIRLWDVPNIP